MERFITVKRRVTDASIEASRLNVERATEARRGVPMSEEHKAKIRASMLARRAKEKQERAAAGLAAAPVEKKKAGRPAKIKPDVETVPRPRGRPKKQTGQNTAINAGTPETGAQGQESLLQEGNEAE